MNGGVNGWRRHVGNFAISCISLTLISNGRMARGQCALNCTTRELDWHAHQLQWFRCRLQLGLTFWSLLWLFLWKVQVEAMRNFCVFFYFFSIWRIYRDFIAFSIPVCFVAEVVTEADNIGGNFQQSFPCWELSAVNHGQNSLSCCRNLGPRITIFRSFIQPRFLLLSDRKR